MGEEEIVYGDKVINLENHRRDDVYPREGSACYVANGEIGLVVGQFKTKKFKRAPWAVQVEFTSQPGCMYSFLRRDFSEEASPALELAYALTVHKAQGSEFGTVIVVLPNPCRLLSRELLYTALTRQKQRVVVLHQGARGDLKKYASDLCSETARRLTNLFGTPTPVEVEGRFFEDGLIHRTNQGELVRSKSEVIIANTLAGLDVEYEYEKPLTVAGVTKYPDFTIEDVETGRTFFWEHCGMLHIPQYRRRWERKREWCRTVGVLPPEEGEGELATLIVTRDSDLGAIDSAAIEKTVRDVVLGETA